MKLTKSQLKQIIKEEIELYEAEGEEVLAALEDVPAEARSMAVKIKKEIEMDCSTTKDEMAFDWNWYDNGPFINIWIRSSIDESDGAAVRDGCSGINGYHGLQGR